MMDKPTSSQPPSGDAPPSMSFNVSQAAALCGVSVPQLVEWTDLGYVKATGSGDRRVYSREGLRQIIRLRRAKENGRTMPGVGGAPGKAAAQRPEEFTVAPEPVDDEHLALQAQMFFALNPGLPVSASTLAERFSVDVNQMRRALVILAEHGSLDESAIDEVFRAGRIALHGPRPRELRIRATRRARVPSQPNE